MKVAVDTETGGLTPGWHEVIQICMLPLDDLYYPDPKKPAFLTHVRPEFPERLQVDALVINGHMARERKNDPAALQEAIDKMMQYPTRKETIKLFLEWYKDVAESTKMSPLAHNWKFDGMMLDHWFMPSHDQGVNLSASFFHYQARDTQRVAMFLQDRAKAKGNPLPFPGISLTKVAEHFKVEQPDAHTALCDAETTAAVYRKMCGID